MRIGPARAAVIEAANEAKAAARDARRLLAELRGALRSDGLRVERAPEQGKDVFVLKLDGVHADPEDRVVRRG